MWKKIIKVLRRFIVFNIGAVLSVIFTKSLFFTLRVIHHELEPLRKDLQTGHPIIFAIWHNRAMLLPDIYQAFRRRGDPPPVTMVSYSDDGLFAGKVLRFYGVKCVYGSSKRGGQEALENMVEHSKRGYNMVLLVDGPRGPLYQVKPGVVKIAQLARARIYGAVYYADRVIRLKSWDRFIIPYPFSRLVICVTKPIEVDPDATADELEEKRKEVERELIKLTEFSEQYFSKKS